MSAQVGSGHIAIFPTMRGFKGTVVRGVKSAGTASATAFSQTMKGVGRTSGAQLGRDLKRGVDTGAAGLGASALKGLTREVASASAALSKARLRQQDDAGRVRVAEARLRDAVARSGEASAQAIAAEERLASARRTHQAATEAVAVASTRLRDVQSRLASATAEMSGSARRAGFSLSGMLQNLHAGFADARAGESAFTGVAGSIGALAKESLILGRNTAVSRWASQQSQQVYQRFISLATMVGGRVAAASKRAGEGLKGIGGYVRSALAPMGQYAAAAGTLLASPFMRLGTRVSSWLSPVTRQVSGLFQKLPGAASTAMAGLPGAVGTVLGRVVGVAANIGSRAGQALGAGLKGAATGGVTAASAAIGFALGSGFSRLTALDTARAKLTGLGNDGKTVAEVMKNATASVKGTAFGLGEASSVAAGAMAAQIKPGRQLETHLKRVANNAAAAGISMGEMGSIFNKAATQANGVQNDVIGQLADKGIPIYQELGKILGVTAGEVFKLASDGKIDFETFSRAAEAAAGTVAEQIGKTVPGAWKNMLASLGRSGANIFGGINKDTGEMYGLYAKFGPLIASVTSVLGRFEGVAANIGAVLEQKLGPGLDWLTNLFEKIGSGSEDLKARFSGLAPLLAPVGAAFAALGSGGLASLLSRIPMLGGMLGGLTGPLAALGGPLGIAAAGLAAFVLSGSDASGIVSGLTGIIDQIVAALPGIVAQVATVVPQIVTSILGQIPALIEAAIGIVGALVDGIVSAVPLLVAGGVQLLQGLLAAILANLPMLIEGALALVSGLLSGIVAALPIIIQGGIQLLMALVTGLVGALPMLLQGVLTLLTGLLGAIVENLPLLIQAGIDLLLSLLTGLIEALPMLITAAITLVLELVAGLLTMLPQLIVAGIELVVALITGLIGAIPQIIEMLPQIVSAIWDGLMGVDWLDLGVQIVMGIINGLGSMVGALVDAIVGLAGAAFDGFKDFFGIASPAKRMKQPGRDVVRGAVAGVEDQAAAFGDSLVDMANAGTRRAERAMTAAVAVSARTSASSSTVAGAAADGAGSGPAPIQVNAHFEHLDPEVAVPLFENRMAKVVRWG